MYFFTIDDFKEKWEVHAVYIFRILITETARKESAP
jgi:hypothetical protein